MATHCSGANVKIDDSDEMGAFSPSNQQRDQLAADASDEINFVAPPPKDLECSLCLQVLKDPTLTSCGHHFCRACIDRVIAKNHVCPLCKEKGFQTMLDRATDRKILALRVRCRMKFRGCQWEGEFADLERHLDVRKGECGFVEVECEFGCTVKMLHGDMPQHMEENTHKHLILLAMPQGGSESERRLQEKRAELLQQQLLRREEKMTQELVTVKREFMTVKRKLQEKDDRVAELQGKLQEQTKEYSKLNKEDQKLHKQIQQTDARTKEELVKMTQEHDRQRKEIQQREKETKQELIKMKQEQSTQIEILCTQLQEKEKRISELQQRVESLERTAVFISTPVITMTNFKKHKRNDDRWFSLPFYSHIREYKMCVGVDANGWGDGESTHVGISVYMMQGEYDDHLHWPFRGEITGQLLNQRRDREHVEMTIVFDDESSDAAAGRVVGRERASIGWGFGKVIAHTAVGYNAEKNTQYLKNDCLKFQVTNIVVKSTK